MLYYGMDTTLRTYVSINSVLYEFMVIKHGK